MIVQVGSQQFLIGVTGQSINQLGELELIDGASDGASQKHDKSSKFTSKNNVASKNKNSAFSKIMSTLTYTKGNQKTAANSNQEVIE